MGIVCDFLFYFYCKSIDNIEANLKDLTPLYAIRLVFDILSSLCLNISEITSDNVVP